MLAETLLLIFNQRVSDLTASRSFVRALSYRYKVIKIKTCEKYTSDSLIGITI